MSRPLRTTASPPPAATVMPSAPLATSTPASTLSQMIDTAWVIVTDPKPPASRQLISPPTAVLASAPAKVLHGAVRLHGLTSSPTPETHVRVAWAFAIAAMAMEKIKTRQTFFIGFLALFFLPSRAVHFD